MKKGKIVHSPSVQAIPLLTKDGDYRYLGILQSDNILHAQTKQIAKKEFLRRIRNILNTELTGRNTADAVRTYAMPIMRYGFGILSWTKDELRAIDRKVRKILTKGKFHHPKSNLHRLYMSRDRGGRGLIGVVDCHRAECTNTAAYLYTASKTDPLCKIILRAEEPKKHGIMSYLTPNRGLLKSTRNTKRSYSK